jgi:hypothetical protein
MTWCGGVGEDACGEEGVFLCLGRCEERKIGEREILTSHTSA